MAPKRFDRRTSQFKAQHEPKRKKENPFQSLWVLLPGPSLGRREAALINLSPTCAAVHFNRRQMNLELNIKLFTLQQTRQTMPVWLAETGGRTLGGALAGNHRQLAADCPLIGDARTPRPLPRPSIAIHLEFILYEHSKWATASSGDGGYLAPICLHINNILLYKPGGGGGRKTWAGEGRHFREDAVQPKRGGVLFLRPTNRRTAK